MAVLELRHLISSRSRAVVHWRKHPGWNKHIYVANIKRYIDPSLFKLCLDASHLPSMVLMNDSVLSSDAATLRPR